MMMMMMNLDDDDDGAMDHDDDMDEDVNEWYMVMIIRNDNNVFSIAYFLLFEQQRNWQADGEDGSQREANQHLVDAAHGKKRRSRPLI